MIALAIILPIIALFVLIFSLRIKLTLVWKDELTLFVSVLGIKYQITPKKQKKYRISRYTQKKIARRDERAAKKAQRIAQRRAARRKKRKSKSGQQAKKASKLTFKDIWAQAMEWKKTAPPLPDMANLFLSVIKLLFSGLFKKFHFHVERLRIKVGGADAAQIALIYTAITNGLHPVFALVEKHSNLHGINRGVRRGDIEISTDYLSDRIEADVKLAFSTSIGGVLWAFIKAAVKLIVGWLKIAPQAQDGDENGKQEKNVKAFPQKKGASQKPVTQNEK